MPNEINAIKVNNVDYSLRDSSKVEKNQAVTGATKCKITYDSKGLVTGGANLEASDIPSLSAGKITSGTFDTARIPSLAASKITSGTFDAARIPDLSSTYSVIGHNHDSSYVTDVAAITSVSDRGCIEVTKNGSSTYIKVDGWDEMVSSIPTTYAGSSSAGGAATSAAKLTNTSKIGDTNKPVYFTANGVPAAISYTIGTNVPSDAVFTDTNYYHTPSYSSGVKIATGTGRNDLYVPTGTAATNVAIGNHTHTITLASDSGTPTVTLSHNTTYKLTAGGNSVIFKTPSDNNTNYYHTPVYTSGGLKIGTGTGVSDMYVPNGSTTSAGVLQIGTGASNAAAGNHNHDSSYVAKNTAITGATKCKITYDAKGLVTAGSDLTASDIPSLSADKITSGTFGIARIPTGDSTSTSADLVVKCNDSRLSNSRPASDVYSWAKASTKPSYNFGEIGAGVATIGDGTNRLMFRTNSGYVNGVYYSTPGNEALVFATKNPVTSWMFAAMSDPTAGTSWQNLIPALQIKKQSVAINKLIGNNVDPAYNLDVNGTLNATTIYQNGTALATVATSGSYNDLSNKPTIPTDTNQKIKADTVTFGNNDVVNIVAGDNVTVTGLASGTGAPKITISATDTDTGATSVGTTGSGNVFSSASYDASTRKITFTKGVAALTSHQSIKSLDTTATTAQSTNSSEAIAGSGTITLHKIAKTGTYSDLIGKPTIPATNVIPATTTANKMLVSTTTSGTAKWSDWSSAGFLKTNTSGVISVDTNSYLTTSGTAADSSKLNGQSASYYQVALPTTTTAGKVLKSTSTAGIVEWGDAGGGGGSTLYRHNLEWVFKTGSSSSGYIYTHFYAYLITNSSTAYTYSTYFGSIATLFKKTVLCGGLYDYSSQEDYGYDGISTVWQPNYSKSGNLNGVYVRYMREGSSTWGTSTYITSSTTAYSFTDHVEPDCDLS